jgi:hypothetical protein
MGWPAQRRVLTHKKCAHIVTYRKAIISIDETFLTTRETLLTLIPGVSLEPWTLSRAVPVAVVLGASQQTQVCSVLGVCVCVCV